MRRGATAYRYPYPGSEMKVRDVTMAKSTSPPERRLITLSILADAGCMSTRRRLNDPHGLVKPYLESLLAEARTLKVDTPEGRNALSALAAKVKYSDPANLAPQPIRPVPMEVDRRELRQANALPAVPATQ